MQFRTQIFPRSQAPLSLSWNVVRMQEGPTPATINKSRIAFVLNSWDGTLSIPMGIANIPH